VKLGLGLSKRNAGLPAPYVYFLDEYPGAAYAYSFRELNSTYTGACFRLRRASDNAETDIGFVEHYVDESAILSFLGPSFGHVVTWYDQSGNSVNKTQPTGGLQPVIAFSGVITKADGFVGMTSNIFTYGAKGMYNAVSGGGATSQAFNVFNEGVGSECLPATNTSSSASKFYGLMQPNANDPTLASGTPTYYRNGSVFTAPTRNTLYSAFNGNLSLLTTLNVDLSGWTESSSLYPGYRGIDGWNMEEIVYYTTAWGRATLEQNIINYYQL